MKSFIVLALFAACVAAAPAAPGSEADAQILKQASDNIGVGGFQNEYETSNGISAQEAGQLKNQGTENEAIEVQGRYSYPGPDGILYVVEYIANEFGFQPQGAHIPKA